LVGVNNPNQKLKVNEAQKNKEGRGEWGMRGTPCPPLKRLQKQETPPGFSHNLMYTLKRI